MTVTGPVDGSITMDLQIALLSCQRLFSRLRAGLHINSIGGIPDMMPMEVVKVRFASGIDEYPHGIRPMRTV